MQSWTCVYCGGVCLDSEALVGHIYRDHRDEMARPESLGKMVRLVLRMLSGEEGGWRAEIACPYCGGRFGHSGRVELQRCPGCGAELLV